jgi:hypothetical protein
MKMIDNDATGRIWKWTACCRKPASHAGPQAIHHASLLSHSKTIIMNNNEDQPKQQAVVEWMYVLNKSGNHSLLSYVLVFACSLHRGTIPCLMVIIQHSTNYNILYWSLQIKYYYTLATYVCCSFLMRVFFLTRSWDIVGSSCVHSADG